MLKKFFMFHHPEFSFNLGPVVFVAKIFCNITSEFPTKILLGCKLTVEIYFKI